MTGVRWIVVGLVAVISIACSDQSPKTNIRADTPGPDCTGDPRVSPATATLHIGDTIRLTAHVGCSASLTVWRWASSKDTIAFVDSGGVVRGVNAGVVTIVASLVADPNVKAAAAITIVP